MIRKVTSSLIDRRLFLTRIVPAGTLACLGCKSLIALPFTQEKSQAPETKHKFQSESGWTYEQIMRYAFGRDISIFQKFINELGKDKILEMLKKFSSELTAENWKNLAKRDGNNDFATFSNGWVEVLKRPDLKHSLTLDIVEHTEKALEFKVTECLWAVPFLESKEPDAKEIGFSLICYADYAAPQAYNPKIRMIRDKTLMQGHAYCNHRYIFEG
jgi:hypothetical protein